MAATASTNDASLISEGGIEKPTHTTPHNQVIVAAIPGPADHVMTNYLELRRQRACSWEDIAAGVESQDPSLADYLRKNGAAFEKAQDDGVDTGLAPVLTERAINPLTTEAERDAYANGAPLGYTPGADTAAADSADTGAHADTGSKSSNGGK